MHICGNNYYAYRHGKEGSIISEPQQYQASIYVTLKPVVNDPQGLAIAEGLRHLGYNTVDGVRAGKYLVVTLAANNQQEAERLVDEMCARLLANPVIEDYRFEVRSK